MVILEPHHRSFPPDPPADPDDPDTVAAHEWTAFAGVRQMSNHWDRPGWTDRTRAYYWLLEFATPALIAQAQRCQAALNPLPVDPIAPDGIHLTLGRVGLTEDVSAHQIARLAAAARDHIPRRFTLQAVPMTASLGAIRYSVAPWSPVLELHQHLSRAGERSGIPPLSPGAHFRPHIGIGYMHRCVPADQVRQAIEPLRQLPPVLAAVDRVHLVRMRRVPGAYQWDTIHTLALES
ncbi:2'-5' RNA ligase family protein [Streptomyces sp. NPDC002221]|uniref:2'-5' RNA ligase family protein n=1 Tax=Streptomyces sp. NPDC002221 TaxID=3364639 RepID=UPI0036A1775A